VKQVLKLTLIVAAEEKHVLWLLLNVLNSSCPECRCSPSGRTRSRIKSVNRKRRPLLSAGERAFSVAEKFLPRSGFVMSLICALYAGEVT